MKKVKHFLLHSRIARIFRLGVLASIVLTILNTAVTVPASFLMRNAMGASVESITKGIGLGPSSWLDLVIRPAVAAKTPEMASSLVPLLCAMLGLLAARIRSWFVANPE